jgi:hypothetical protein
MQLEKKDTAKSKIGAAKRKRNPQKHFSSASPFSFVACTLK